MKMEKKKRINLGAGVLTAPVPPVMVTVGDMENSNIITIGWTGILATKPPKTYISVRPERYSYKILKERGEFVINLASKSLAYETDFAGIYSGKTVDKFKRLGLTKHPSEKVACPTIAECPVSIECRVSEIIPMGTHDVFIADILSVSCREDIVDKDGRADFALADLLAYAHGEYYALGERLGKIGFSTDKRRPKEKEKAKEKAKDSAAPEKKRAPFYKAVAKRQKRTPQGDKDRGKPKRRDKK
jgi:flavin reductase (DIM6/NTAB) family NADH-FMN oxidoreductase RutF